VNQNVRQLTFHPYGVYRLRRENYGEPIATVKCVADLILPLLCSDYVCLTVPNRHAVPPEHHRYLIGELPVEARIRKKNLSRELDCHVRASSSSLFERFYDCSKPRILGAIFAERHRL